MEIDLNNNASKNNKKNNNNNNNNSKKYNFLIKFNQFSYFSLLIINNNIYENEYKIMVRVNYKKYKFSKRSKQKFLRYTEVGIYSHTINFSLWNY